MDFKRTEKPSQIPKAQTDAKEEAAKAQSGNRKQGPDLFEEVDLKDLIKEASVSTAEQPEKKAGQQTVGIFARQLRDARLGDSGIKIRKDTRSIKNSSEGASKPKVTSTTDDEGNTTTLQEITKYHADGSIEKISESTIRDMEGLITGYSKTRTMTDKDGKVTTLID